MAERLDHPNAGRQRLTEQAPTAAGVEWSGEDTGAAYVDAMQLGFNRHTLKLELGLTLSGRAVKREVSVLMNPSFARELVAMLTGAMAVYAKTYPTQPADAASSAPGTSPTDGRGRQP